jgi:nucleoid-associated protein Lsr2
VSVVITDDLDGSPGDETVSFGLDGVSYEIDLGQPNQARLAGAFAAFIAAGRRVSRGSRRRAADSAGGPRADRRAVRAWAREDADGARRR